MDDIRDMIAAQRGELGELLAGLPTARWDEANAKSRVAGQNSSPLPSNSLGNASVSPSLFTYYLHFPQYLVLL